jgi:hypothetical protein
MSNLDFLEVNPNFKIYYQTLRDANYYFRNRPELLGTNQIIAELLLNFIGVNGTTFRDMNPEEYERDYRIFEDDFLDVIENSALNNVEFQTFAGLIDEIIGIARMRANALQKMNRRNEDNLLEDVEIVMVPNDEDLPNGPSEIYVTISDGNNLVEDENDEESVVEMNQYILDDQNDEESFVEMNQVILNDQNDEEDVEEFVEEDVDEDVEDPAELNEILFDEGAAERNEMFDDEDVEKESTTNNREIGRPYIKYRYENS